MHQENVHPEQKDYAKEGITMSDRFNALNNSLSKGTQVEKEYYENMAK